MCRVGLGMRCGVMLALGALGCVIRYVLLAVGSGVLVVWLVGRTVRCGFVYVRRM